MSKKKDKLEQIPPAPEGTCNYYVQKKKRYCTFQVKPGERFCPMHSSNIQTKYRERKRIPCPLDPNQFIILFVLFLYFFSLFSSVFEDQLQKHLKKCNATKQSSSHLPFFSKGFNLNEEQINAETSSEDTTTHPQIGNPHLVIAHLVLVHLLNRKRKQPSEPICSSNYLKSSTLESFTNSLPEDKFCIFLHLLC